MSEITDLNDLERFWSPEDILAYKWVRNYSWRPVGQGGLFKLKDSYRSYIGSMQYEIGEEYEATCMYKKFDNLYMTCVGEAPTAQHFYTDDYAGYIANSPQVVRTRPSCGFYAYKFDYYETSSIAYGNTLMLVAMSGVVVEFEHGYRAQKMRIVKELAAHEPGLLNFASGSQYEKLADLRRDMVSEIGKEYGYGTDR